MVPQSISFGQHLISFLFVILIGMNVLQVHSIPSSSMEPTLRPGDHILAVKLAAGSQIQRGDLVLFHPPSTDNSKLIYVKRAIGLPGETIEVKDDMVYINHQALSEPYLLEPPFYTSPPVKIASHSLFVMGDNRNNSVDSHVFGPLPLANVVSRAVGKTHELNWPIELLGLPVYGLVSAKE